MTVNSGVLTVSKVASVLYCTYIHMAGTEADTKELGECDIAGREIHVFSH